MSSILGPQRFEVIVDREKFEKDLVSVPFVAVLFIHVTYPPAWSHM